MASGMPKVMETTMGVSALGRTWRVSTRASARRGRGRLDELLLLERQHLGAVWRAIPTQPVSPRAMEDVDQAGAQHGHDQNDEEQPRNAYITSMKRVIAISVLPPT
jgi:hypothetical protein